jgi:hypothetical protein
MHILLGFILAGLPLTVMELICRRITIAPEVIAVLKKDFPNINKRKL